MESKWFQGGLIAGLSLLSLVFLIMGNLDVAVLFMTLLFVSTNSFRYMRMKKEGMHREAKWMGGMAIVFAIMFFVVLFAVVL